MRAARAFALLAVAAVLVTGPGATAGVLTGASSSVTPPFVTRGGTQLLLDGQPYRPIGLNIYNANSNGGCWYQMGGSILDDSLTAIGPGKNAMRAWFFQPLATSGGVRDWSAFDHTLAAAAAHGVRVVATLGNQWPDCDGPNAGAGAYKDAAWYGGGYANTTAPGGTVSYRDWVAEIVSRYKDDPTILAWQLVNEPEVGDCSSVPEADATTLLQHFASDVSGLIKSIDPNHLVSLGTIGGGQCGAQGDDYKAVMSDPGLDLCEFHDYTPSQLIPGDQWNGLQRRIQQCNELGKPLLVGELGVKPSDVGGSLRDRANVVSSKLCAQLTAGVAGVLLWAWDKDGSLLNNFDIGPGDPVLDVLSPWSDASHSCSAPSAPLGVQAAGGDGSATVSWTAPATDGGSPVTSYTVTSIPGGLTKTVVGTTARISGLTNGIAYSFTVRATNNVGTGPSSGTSAEITPGTTSGYRPVDLGTLGGDQSQAIAVNDGGQVVGDGHTAAGDTHAFSWTQAGGMIDLATLGGDFSQAFAVNDDGQVVGVSLTAGGQKHAFSWTEAGGMVDLGTLGGGYSTAGAVNGAGQVVGDSYTAGGEFHAFSWTEAGGMVDLGTLGGDFSEAADPAYGAFPPGFGVSDGGQVVGRSKTADGDTHAFSWTQAGGIIDLGTLGAGSAPFGASSLAVAVNAGGGVVGWSSASGNQSHPFFWTQAGGMIDLGTLGGDYGQAHAVNDSGQVVGESNTAGNAQNHAFSWTQAGGMVDIGTLGGNESHAYAVNDGGQTIGTGFTAGGTEYHAFLWNQAGGMTDLGTLGGSTSEGRGVNDGGEVVGLGNTTDDAEQHAALWLPVTAAVPGAPGGVVAAAGDGSASISWIAPASDGGSSITGYTVTASPGGATASVSGSARTASISPLTNGIAYTFTIRATNVAGTGPASSASSAVTPQTGYPPPTTATGTASPSSPTTVSTGPAPPPGGTATSITVPAGTAGGTVSIAATGTTGSAPSGYSFLGQQVNITAPDAIAASPLVLVFLIDGAALTQAGLDYTTVQILRDGVAIAACDPTTAAASPDPCVSARAPLSGGSGARLTIRSSRASAWNFGASRPLCATTKVTSSVAGFNKTAIKAASYIWFNGVVKATGLGTTAVTLKFSSQTITFNAGVAAYKLVIPDGLIRFSPTAASAATTFTGNQWMMTVPIKQGGNVFLSGFGFRVPVNLPGGLSPVTWQGIFSADKSGVSVNWQWGAAVYSQFSALNTLLGVKPVDDGKTSSYKNSDLAGTPENYKAYLIAGARGNGNGSNYTGSYTASTSAAPCK